LRRPGLLSPLPPSSFFRFSRPETETAKVFSGSSLPFFAFALFGFQGFYAKVAMRSMSAESVFVYMTISNLLFIPLEYHLTDFSQPISWNAGYILLFLIHIMNAAAALLAIYSLRYGKVIIVSPIAAMAPMITTLLSLIIYARLPYYLNGIGIILSMAAIFMVTYGELLSEKKMQKKVMKTEVGSQKSEDGS
jgi:uncharacterized membrane protein